MFRDADVRPTPQRVPVRRGRAVVAAGGVLLLAGLAAGPAVAADAPVALGAQAWFQRDPSCATPLGCSPTAPPPSNPFGAGTLHVAVTGGQENARSYLTLTGLRAGATVTGGTLTVPLDTMTPGNGSTAPETSKVQVCTTIATVPAVEGSFDRPPQEDCSNHASAAYVATPAPHLQADLAPLAGALSAPSVALVLLPDGAVTTSDFWHVVFSATNRATPPTPPASVTLTLAGADGPPGPVTPVTPATDPPSSAAPSPTAAPSHTARPATKPRSAKAPSAVATTAHVAPVAAPPVAPPPVAPPPVDGSVVAAGAPPLPVAAPVVPQPSTAPTPSAAPAASAAAGVPPAAEAPQQPAPAQAAPVAFTTGYAYPIVWLLPILLVAAVVAVGRAMTRDLTPARPSR